MRRILYVVIIASLFFLPVERLDIAKLEPVQTVAISREEDMVVLLTDTDNQGKGKNAELALQDLEEKTPGVIYLDTAQYLLIGEDAQSDAEALRKYLMPSVKVSMWDGEGSVISAAKYLDVRKDLPKLKQWRPDAS